MRSDAAIAYLEPQRPTPEAEVDKVLGAAVHELGHITVFARVGIKMHSVRVQRRWFTRLGAEGGVWTDDPMWDDPVQVQGFLVGLMAGMAAEQMWLERVHHWDTKRAREFADLGGGGDRPMFRCAAEGRMDMGTARARARVLVGENWSVITRRAPVLRRYREMKVKKLAKS